MNNKVITWLNARFPVLPEWHLALLVFAAMFAAGCAVQLLASGAGFVGSLGPFLLLIVLWRPVPAGKWKRLLWWLMVVVFSYPVVGILYYWLLRHF